MFYVCLHTIKMCLQEGLLSVPIVTRGSAEWESYTRNASQAIWCSKHAPSFNGCNLRC